MPQFCSIPKTLIEYKNSSSVFSQCINITFYTLKDMKYMDDEQDAVFGREGV